MTTPLLARWRVDFTTPPALLSPDTAALLLGLFSNHMLLLFIEYTADIQFECGVDTHQFLSLQAKFLSLQASEWQQLVPPDGGQPLHERHARHWSMGWSKAGRVL